MHGDTKVRILKTRNGKFFLARVGHYDQRVIEEVYMNLAGEVYGITYNGEKKFVPLEEANNIVLSTGGQSALMIYDTLAQAQVDRDIVKGQRRLIAIVLSSTFAENYSQL